MTLPDSDVNSIGGYFELELPSRKILPYPESLKFHSARAAFLALIRTGKPKRIWMPRYICDAMLSPLHSEKIECVWYDVNDKLDVDNNVNLEASDWLLYVNYYGVCNDNVATLLQRFSPEQIVLDFSQSFFESPIQTLATIYSPRKFFGIPDGGMLVTNLSVVHPETQDEGSLGRMSHLLLRLGASPESGYVDYQRSEQSLMDSEPKKMSKLTEGLFSTIDLDYVRKKREENFLFLNRELGRINSFEFDIATITAPLCYPFLTNNGNLRQCLINNRVFVPTYWPEAINRVSEAWAYKMIRNFLPLPIDQRYDFTDMEKIISIIQDKAHELR